MQTVRLLYVSKMKDTLHKEQTLADILNEAKAFNARHAVYGVLHFGNDFFIQCLEGEKSIVDELFYQKIVKDPRHKNCEIMYYQEQIDTPLFHDWHMKYVVLHQEILAFFELQQICAFDPYELSAENIPAFIALLAQQNDQTPLLSTSES